MLAVRVRLLAWGTNPLIQLTLFIMARVHYGTSRLYDEYASVIDAYIQEVHGLDHLKPNVVTEMLMETIERPTSVEHHGGDYAPVYAVQDVA